MNHKRDHGKQEQQVDQGSRNMKDQESKNPRNQQDHKQRHEYESHETPFLSRDGRIRWICALAQGTFSNTSPLPQLTVIR
jgi:hypothetical protein